MNESEVAWDSKSFGDSRRRLTTAHRSYLILGSLAIFVLFGVAARLKPDPSGHGTHRQLGLPPCTFQFVLGIPCPTCGFTTTWSLMMHGRWWQAVQTNFGGALLWLFAATCGVWMFVSGCQGRWFGQRPTTTFFAVAITPIALISVLLWIGRVMAVMWN
ncbi:MAG: DUF2752 domain-containing protein [Pirellulaceae bacterium]|jgi:hypothetical protein|nr:DUF2752 domain-containing protein [Pirellulaceae bacterium]